MKKTPPYQWVQQYVSELVQTENRIREVVAQEVVEEYGSHIESMVWIVTPTGHGLRWRLRYTTITEAT